MWSGVQPGRFLPKTCSLMLIILLFVLLPENFPQTAARTSTLVITQVQLSPLLWSWGNKPLMPDVEKKKHKGVLGWITCNSMQIHLVVHEHLIEAFRTAHSVFSTQFLMVTAWHDFSKSSKIQILVCCYLTEVETGVIANDNTDVIPYNDLSVLQRIKLKKKWKEDLVKKQQNQYIPFWLL